MIKSHAARQTALSQESQLGNDELVQLDAVGISLSPI